MDSTLVKKGVAMINPSAMQEALNELDATMEHLADALTTDEWLEFLPVFRAVRSVAKRHNLKSDTALWLLLVPALCSICHRVVTAHWYLDDNKDVDIEDTKVFIMDEHNLVDYAGNDYGRCEGSGTAPQTLRIK